MNNGLTNIRQVEGQRVESEREITGSEAEEILRRYGYEQNQKFSTREEPVKEPNNDLTFEEMFRQQEEQRKSEENRRLAEINGPKPITFNGRSGYESESKYISDDELGFGFKIEITTDMKLPE